MGRGSMKGNDGGGGGGNINVINATDMWSYRHGAGNTPFADGVNNAMKSIDADFPGFMQSVNTVDAVTMSGKDATQTLGFWSPSDKQLAINANYTDVAKMNTAMDAAARSGFHPSRGNKSGAEAVALHEAGHALTDHIAQKTGSAGLHETSERVVKAAYKNSGAKGGTRAFAGQISGYAQKNYAETVAEAVADWYCNGNKASGASKAIMTELRKYS